MNQSLLTMAFTSPGGFYKQMTEDDQLSRADDPTSRREYRVQRPFQGRPGRLCHCVSLLLPDYGHWAEAGPFSQRVFVTLCMYSNQLGSYDDGSTHNPHLGTKHTCASFLAAR